MSKLWLPAFLWVIFILVISTITVPEFDKPDLFFSVDKVGHFFVYGILTLLLILPLRRRANPFSPYKAIIVAFAISASYGIIIEVYQKFVGRFMEFYDAVANAIGAGLACMGYLVVHLLFFKKTGGAREQREHPAEN